MSKYVKLLNESLEYLKNNPRGFGPPTSDADDASTCAYINDEGSRCLVGRLLPKRVCKDLEKKFPQMISASGFYDSNFALIRKGLTRETYDRIYKFTQDYNQEFMRKLQSFHDGDRNWDHGDKRDLPKNTLSVTGKEYFDSLMELATKLDGQE